MFQLQNVLVTDKGTYFCSEDPWALTDDMYSAHFMNTKKHKHSCAKLLLRRNNGKKDGNSPFLLLLNAFLMARKIN